MITLFVWLFILEESGIDVFGLVVEGDDNLAGYDSDQPIKEHLFKDLGLIAKIEYPRAYNEASFCGMIFSPTSNKILTDPIKVINRFGWLDSKSIRSSDKTVMELYRGKALCNIYQYRDCPMIDSFSRAVLRVTRPITSAAKVTGKHHLNQEYIPTDESRLPKSEKPDPEARLIVEELFGISAEMQIIYEQYFDSVNTLFNIPHLGLFPETQNLNWNMNVSSLEERPFPSLVHPFSTYIKFLNHCSQLNSTIIDLEKMIYQLNDLTYQFHYQLPSQLLDIELI